MPRTNFARSLAYVLSVCLLATSLSFQGVTAGANAPFADDTDDGARQFDDAVRDVQSILSLDFSDEKNFKQAENILKRNEKKLANSEKKALQAASRVDAFKKGLKAEAAKRKNGATELANELESNPGSVASIPGAEEAAEAIRRSTQPAADILQKVADALQKAGDAAKKKAGGNGHHASRTATPSLPVAKSVEPFNPELFCAQYQAICDLLTRLALWELRRQIAAITAGTRKANCVVNAYVTYGGCTITRPWDLAYCNSQLATRLRFCVLYG